MYTKQRGFDNFTRIEVKTAVGESAFVQSGDR